MELVKKNIHMDRIRSEAVSQITLEDDLNVPDQKPDVSSLNFENGAIIIDEIRPGTDQVNVRGRLSFDILYHTEEGGSSLISLQGKIPFEEKINMQGVRSTDDVMVEGQIEDLSVNIINSRKLNIQAVVTLNSWVEELYDEEAPIGMYGEDAVEYRKAPFPLAQIAINKKDIFRVKEELSLPSNYPNIFQILWSSVSLEDMDFRVLDEKISLSGEVRVFVLYEGEGEEHPVRTFEQTIPISGIVECHGCREGMVADIRASLAPQEHGQPYLTARPDFDGEERNIGVDLVLNILMKMYEEESIDIITDIYGVTKEVETVTGPCTLRRLLARVGGKTRVNERVRARSGGSGIMQLLHSEGRVSIEDQQAVEGGIQLSGSVWIHVLYITGNDEAPYGSFQTQIPFRYTLEVADMAPEDMGMVRGEVEQLQVTMLDGEEMDVKAILSFSTIAFRNVPLNMIRDVQISDLDTAVLASLPGMAVYVVRPGDNLWNIGRKYYVPVDTLRSVNRLDSDELKVGQKLLIVKGA